MSTEHHRYAWYGAVLFAVQTDLMICSSVLDMDDQMLDDYLEFCEKTLLPREDRMPGKFSSVASASTESKANGVLQHEMSPHQTSPCPRTPFHVPQIVTRWVPRKQTWTIPHSTRI